MSFTAGWLLGPFLVLLPFAIGGSGLMPQGLTVGAVIALICLTVEIAIVLDRRRRSVPE